MNGKMKKSLTYLNNQLIFQYYFIQKHFLLVTNKITQGTYNNSSTKEQK